MSLKQILFEKKDVMLALWFERILDTYPAETAKFLKNQKDRFANPVGQTIHEGMDGIFQELVQGGEVGKVSGFLDAIIRVRAIQEFTAAQAVAFIFSLKNIIRDGIRDIPRTAELAEESRTGHIRIGPSYTTPNDTQEGRSTTTRGPLPGPQLPLALCPPSRAYSAR